jgi:hypothetical protein
VRGLLAPLLGKDPERVSAGQMTYDLRSATRSPPDPTAAGSHRYHVTDTGIHHALFLTRAHDRLLRDGLAQLTEPADNRLRAASLAYQHAIDHLATESGLAA